MNLADTLSGPWAIVPEKLVEIHAIAAAHARGESRDIAAIEAQLGRPLSNTQKPTQVVDSVAVVPLSGVLAKRLNMMTQVSGGTSTQLAAQDLQRAIDDPAVTAIVLAIDSPGGTVDGVESLANIVRAGAQKKRIVALADGLMASAAYWIGSAVGPGNIYLAERTTQVGSIGVVAKHVDLSGSEAQQGVKTTEITAGQYKRVASSYAPLSAAGRDSIQAQVDYLYQLFVDSVARDRGVSSTTVLERMADGRVFTGQQAIDAGLADGFSTLAQLIDTVRRAPARLSNATSTTKATMRNTTGFSESELRKTYADHPHIQARYGTFDAYATAMSSSTTASGAALTQDGWADIHRQATALSAANGITYTAAVSRLLKGAR